MSLAGTSDLQVNNWKAVAAGALWGRIDRFRVAGTAEFNGFNKDIRAHRIRPLADWTRDLFPGIEMTKVVPWSGLRPMMPSMLPYMKASRRPNVFYNTGHGHLGWTLSAATSEIVAEKVRQAVAGSG